MNKIKFVEPEINLWYLDNNFVLTESGWSRPVLPPDTKNTLADDFNLDISFK